jgi:hypothetical protein
VTFQVVAQASRLRGGEFQKQVISYTFCVISQTGKTPVPSDKNAIEMLPRIAAATVPRPRSPP